MFQWNSKPALASGKKNDSLGNHWQMPIATAALKMQ